MLQTQTKTQTPSQPSTRSLSYYFSELGVREGSADRPIPKWQRPFYTLRYSFQRSVLRSLLTEGRNFYRRIVVLLKTDRQVLPHVCQQCLEDYMVLLSCSEDMTQLQKDHLWLGLLDVRVAAEAWVLGFQKATYTLHTEENNKTHPSQSSSDLPRAV
jgi:hypothetical protein